MSELNESIIKWINELPGPDPALSKGPDRDLELLIDLLKEGGDMQRLRDLFGKLSEDLDKKEGR